MAIGEQRGLEWMMLSPIRFPSRVGGEHGPYTLERLIIAGVCPSNPPAVCLAYTTWPRLTKQIRVFRARWKNLAACTSPTLTVIQFNSSCCGLQFCGAHDFSCIYYIPHPRSPISTLVFVILSSFARPCDLFPVGGPQPRCRPSTV